MSQDLNEATVESRHAAPHRNRSHPIPDGEAAAVLARFVAETRYEHLPAAARDMARRCLLDTVGVTVAASTRGIGHQSLIRMIRQTGGLPESSVMGFGGRVPTWLAALANGAMARAVDFDDSHDESMTHPSSVVIPAALAMAERRGGVGGRELITAIVLGNEILCRMGLAIARRPGGLKLDTWFPTSVFGAFGGTAACGAIMGFDADTVRNAFGIVLFEAAGTLEAFSASGQRGMMRGMITGMTAKSATMAATMAQHGITGVPDSIDGEFGLYRVYYGGPYERPVLLGDLGERFESVDIAMKPWPTCRYTHSYIDATIQLVTEADIRPQAIEQVRIHVAGYAESRCVPLLQQQTPHNYNHAGHALPYLVALAAARRHVTMDDLMHSLDEREILDLAQRVVPVHDPRFSIENRVGPSLVEIRLKGGGSRRKQLEHVYGGPQHPMSWDDLVAKFRLSMAHSARPNASDVVDRLVDRIAHLEDVPDVSELTQALA